jgi:hypothetical protein
VQAGERARPACHTNCAQASSYNSSEPGYIPAMLRKELDMPPKPSSET